MITFDFETRSYADLLKVGAWAYSEDPTTDVICCSYGIDSRPVQSWWRRGAGGVVSREPSHVSDGIPYDLQEALDDGHVIEAHNVAFERSIWMNIMAPLYGWPLPDDYQWRDTMATACYYAMPAKLDKLANVLGYEGKDPEGARLITKYSKLYLKTAKLEVPDDDFYKFVNYCEHDVKMEQSVTDELGLSFT